MVVVLFIPSTTSSGGSCGRLRNPLLQELKGWIIRWLDISVYKLRRGLRSNLILELPIGHLLARGSELGFILVNLTVSNVVILSPFRPCTRSRRRHLGVTEREKMVFLGVWWMLRRRREELLEVAVLILGHRHAIFNELGFSLLLRIMPRWFRPLLFCGLHVGGIVECAHLDWWLSEWVLFQFNIHTIKLKFVVITP